MNAFLPITLMVDGMEIVQSDVHILKAEAPIHSSPLHRSTLCNSTHPWYRLSPIDLHDGPAVTPLTFFYHIMCSVSSTDEGLP